MPSAADRIDFGPPRDAGAIRSLGLALLVHAALIAALTWGVNWKRSDRSVAFEAELWSNTPQEAAPKLAEAPPLPPPRPELTPKVRQAPAPEPTPKVDIALEQEKKRKQQVQLAQQAQADKDAKLKQEQAKLKAAEDAKKLDAKKQQQRLQQTQANAAAQEAQRQQNIARAMGLAGATGGEAAKGTAQKSSGPNTASTSYGGKVKSKVKPNIVFTEDISGNPSAEVEVRTALDGSIISQKLIKSSGNKAWDDAVVKAIIRTEMMPRDVDGRVPTPMIIEFRPKD